MNVDPSRSGDCLVQEAIEGADASEHRGRRSRRLSDKLLVAFHLACDQGQFVAAEELLRILEAVLERLAPGRQCDRRRSAEGLVAAHQRLWELRHPE